MTDKTNHSTHVIHTNYNTWRNQVELADPEWQPKFNKGLAPVGCLLWVKVGSSQDLPMLCRRTGYVRNKDNLPEYEMVSNGHKFTGDFAWCIY